MKIQVIGTGCDKCTKMYENAKQAIAAAGVDAELVKVEDLMDIVKLGVMTSPSLMIDGKLVISGTTASIEKIEKCIRESKN